MKNLFDTREATYTGDCVQPKPGSKGEAWRHPLHFADGVYGGCWCFDCNDGNGAYYLEENDLEFAKAENVR